MTDPIGVGSTARDMVVVGIGASAGGLDALRALFGGMPATSGMSFVVVTHLARASKSALAGLLGNVTTMPVAEAADGVTLRADHVHVAPAGTVVTVEGLQLRVRPVDGAAPIRRPIDLFMGSLAQSQGENAVGIVLSGSGTDGTLGLKAIREHGGLTIAQGSGRSSPEHPGMPNSAIAAGLADLVLPSEEMPGILLHHAGIPAGAGDPRRPGAGSPHERERTEAARQAIHALMRDRVGHSFSGYKDSTFLRRVRRRMDLLQIDEIEDYAARLERDPDEILLLFRDLLIGVTSFFRDEDSFAALESHVIPRLFANKGSGDEVRVWVPGCATGEEAYSLAILLAERAERLKEAPELKVLASDINEEALEVARAGSYPAALMQGIGAERRRFFTERADIFTIAAPVRSICTFAAHSILRDPPYSRLDLISCRNLLIYLTAEQQAQLVPLFHFALRPGGFLFLGAGESLMHHADLFQPLDSRARIFERREHGPARSSFRPSQYRPKVSLPSPPRGSGSAALVRHAAEERVLERFAPAHVVVNAAGHVVHFSARTDGLLRAPSGQPTQDLLLLARKELRHDLRVVLQQALETKRPARRDRIVVNRGRDRQILDIVVDPLKESDAEALYLVVFDVTACPADDGAESLPLAEPDGNRLESELRETQDRLQAVIEEHETGIERLRAGNEELVALNEELQSTNEELETNAEEIQSVNEELNTVNAELTLNIEQLNQAQNDLRNVVDSTQIALVFLDAELRIRSFTGAAAGLFNLVASDRGRPLGDITHKLDYGEIDRDIRAAVTNREATEKRVVTRDGRSHYLLRVLPYQGSGGATEGATVTLVDIGTMVGAERQLRDSFDELSSRLQQQGAIAEFGAMALRATDVDALLTEASAVSAKCLGIQRAKVLQLLPEGASFLITAGVGWSPNVVGKAVVGADSRSPAGVALMTGEPVVSEDLERDERFDVPQVLRDHGIKSAINVIIRGEGEPFGVLEVDSQESRQFGPDDINFLQSCANLVAAALDRLRNERELQRALEEKQVLLYELQHRVKNSLQEMSALVNIERRKAQNEPLRRALEVLGARLEALRVIYRKLYLVDHHTEIDLGDYLGELSGDLFAFHGVDSQSIARDLQLQAVRVNLDQALPLGLIACEFIVNSLKHAFPDGKGRIWLSLDRQDETRARLELGDNGTGLPPAGNQGGGSGLQLIRRLVAQIGGSLDLGGPNGVTMTILFPLNRKATAA